MQIYFVVHNLIIIYTYESSWKEAIAVPFDHCVCEVASDQGREMPPEPMCSKEPQGLPLTDSPEKHTNYSNY